MAVRDKYVLLHIKIWHRLGSSLHSLSIVLLLCSSYKTPRVCDLPHTFAQSVEAGRYCNAGVSSALFLTEDGPGTTSTKAIGANTSTVKFNNL